MKVFALVGSPLGHTLSPLVHSVIFKRLGLPYHYIPWDVSAGEVEVAVSLFRKNLAGFNVTSPHKQRVGKYLDALDLSAELYGAVNTVQNEKGRLIGYNTDGYGFLKGLSLTGYDPGKKQVLLLGAGGAAQAIALELVHLGAHLTIANRGKERLQRLKSILAAKFPKAAVQTVGWHQIPRQNYQLVINATPLGSGALSQETPLHSQYLSGVELVYDLIYNPPQTKLLQLAQTMGCRIQNGLAMLVYQGLKAEEIWQGHSFSEQELQAIFADLKKEGLAWPEY